MSSSAHNNSLQKEQTGLNKFLPTETSPRKVDSWLRKDESGVTVRSFFCQSKRIDTNRMDWKKANSGMFSKKRLIYQNGGHNVWTKLWRLGQLGDVDFVEWLDPQTASHIIIATSALSLDVSAPKSRWYFLLKAPCTSVNILVFDWVPNEGLNSITLSSRMMLAIISYESWGL